uniref:ZAD domain-containing protein n=1 Tax=Anopheles christyi TaxID=43041 RepID=A0A182K6Y8_9DIPT
MTRIRIDGSVNPETTSLPDDFAMDYAVDYPAEANSDWTDEVIVKSEIILPEEQLSPTKRCRLCHSSDHIWVPCFSLGGGIELTPGHIETINRISDILITYETDFSSVICSYCLVKIEEFTVLRDVWKCKNKEVYDRDVPASKPLIPMVCMKAADMTDASTQTIASDYPIAQSSTEVSDCVASSKKEPEPEQDSIIIDDEDEEDPSSQSEVINVEQYYSNLSKRRRTKSTTKKELVNETMRLIKRQYRRKRH